MEFGSGHNGYVSGGHQTRDRAASCNRALTACDAKRRLDFAWFAREDQNQNAKSTSHRVRRSNGRLHMVHLFPNHRSEAGVEEHSLWLSVEKPTNLRAG
ncbi:hypothetical protein D3C77_419240 [compost metagenome]